MLCYAARRSAVRCSRGLGRTGGGGARSRSRKLRRRARSHVGAHHPCVFFGSFVLFGRRPHQRRRGIERGRGLRALGHLARPRRGASAASAAGGPRVAEGAPCMSSTPGRDERGGRSCGARKRSRRRGRLRSAGGSSSRVQAAGRAAHASGARSPSLRCAGLVSSRVPREGATRRRPRAPAALSGQDRGARIKRGGVCATQVPAWIANSCSFTGWNYSPRGTSSTSGQQCATVRGTRRIRGEADTRIDGVEEHHGKRRTPGGGMGIDTGWARVVDTKPVRSVCRRATRSANNTESRCARAGSVGGRRRGRTDDCEDDSSGGAPRSESI